MENEGHTTSCNVNTRRPKDGPENLILSPHRSRRLEEKAKALNKCRLSLEDLLCNVDKRNEKFGYVVTNIGSLKSDHSPSKTSPDNDPKSCKKSLTSTIGSSDLVQEHCKLVYNNQEVLTPGENYSYTGDLHGRKCTNYSKRSLDSRVAEAVRDISKSQKSIEPTPKRLICTKSGTNKSEILLSDADELLKKNSSMSVVCEGSSERINSVDVAHPIKEIEAASHTSMGSSDSRVKDHSSKGLSNQGIVASSVSKSETTTMHETIDYHSKVCSVIEEGNSLPSQYREDQAKNLTAMSVLENETGNVSVIETKAKSESPQKSPLLSEKNKSKVEVSSSECTIMTEEGASKLPSTQASQGTDFIDLTKITLRSFKNSSVVIKDKERSDTLSTKSLREMRKQTKSPEECETDHSEQALNESENIVSSSLSVCSSQSPLYSGSLSRHIKVDRSGVAIINLVNSDFSSKCPILIQPEEKSANASVEAAIINEIGSASASSGKDSACNHILKEALATSAEKHAMGEEGRSSLVNVRVTEDRKETKISSPKSLKKGDPSPKSPEVLFLGVMPKSMSNLPTRSTNTLKQSPGKNRSKHSRNTVANAAVRNLFTDECTLISKVDHNNTSSCDQENHSNEALDIVEKAAVELKGISHSSPHKTNMIKSSEADEKLSSDSQITSRVEIPSVSPGCGNTVSFVFDADEDLEKCEHDVLSRHQKGDYSCGFIGFKDDPQISCSRDQPIVVLERLPSWILKNKTVKLKPDTSPLKDIVQEPIDPRISEEELLNRKEELQLKRQYKSMSDLSELIHCDLEKEREFMMNKRRVTRSFGEEIKVDYMAKLPDERDFKFKKTENDEYLPFLGFNIPFGFLGLPDHYLVYRSIIDKSKQLGFQIDPNLGIGNLDEKSESLYFMGECNPFRYRPMIPEIERDKISPTKILEIASVNRNIHSQFSLSPERFKSESHDALFLASPEKFPRMESLSIESQQDSSACSVKVSKKQTPRHSPSKHAYSVVGPELQKSECNTDLNDGADNMDNKQTKIVGSACGKDFCRLGCICESLEVKERVKEHCGHDGCMFSSSCCKVSSKSSNVRTKMSILEHIDVSSTEEELVRSKRKRKIPARLIQDEIICSPVSLGGKKQCYNSSIFSLSEERPRDIAECRVVLNRFNLTGANVRCLYHYRQNCPCLRNKSLERPRNVALKSTSGRLQFNPHFIVGHSQMHSDVFNIRPLGCPVSMTPKPALKTSYRPGMERYRSTIIYPQSLSRVKGSNSSSNGIIDSADSLVMKEDLHIGGTLRYFFNNMTEFQHTLSKGKMKCSDLEIICSESLTYLAKGAVQIMKLSFLKEMLQKEQAFLWMMHLPQGRAHVFLSKENKAPGVACQRVRDLDELSRLPSHVNSLFTSSETDNDRLISCIQISQSYFWQIIGTISFLKNDSSNKSKTGTVITNITDNKPLWTASTKKKTVPKGFTPVNLIPLRSSDCKATNSLCNSKKLKAVSHSNINLFHQSQHPHVAANAQPSVSSNSSPPIGSCANYRIWYELDLNKPFDELQVKSNKFRITRLKLLQLFSLARSRKSFVRVSFTRSKVHSKKPLPGILVYPNDKKYSVKLGPFPLNKSHGVKTYKIVNKQMIETVPYLTINRIIKREATPSQHEVEGGMHAFGETNQRESFEEEEIIPQNVSKASEDSKMINPMVSEIVSTKDADPGLTIVIQDVQGHYDSFNDIPSPKKSSVSCESDTPEIWPVDSTVSYVEESNVKESGISYQMIPNASETAMSSNYSLSESNAFSSSADTFVKDNNHSLQDSNTFCATESEEMVPNYNLTSNEFMLNHEELILKEEPKSDPLDEHDCDPLASSPTEILPDPLETTYQCDWSGSAGLKEIVVEKPTFMHSSSRSVPKTTSIKKKQSVLGELKKRNSFMSKRSILKRNMLSPKAKKLPQSPAELMKTSGNVETGYLIPDVPGIQPIPVARGGMTDRESKAITMKNPMSKEGKLVHILDLGLANLYLNEAVLQRVNFFPNNMKINWAFVRVDGMASKENFEGLMNLGDLTSNMFITPKGVFTYDEAIRSRSVLQRCGIGMESIHRFMEAKRRRHIINIRKQLAALLQLGKKGNTLIATIRHARQEIEKLKAECNDLENQIYHEGCLRTSLLSRLREVASDKERATIMKSLGPLKRRTVANQTEEDGKDKWTLGDFSGNFAPRQVKGRARRRLSAGYEEDDDWIPIGSKRNIRVRETEGNGSESRKKLPPVKDKPQSKPQAKTALRTTFQKQMDLLKKHLISRNSYKSKGVGSSGETPSYSILKNAKSVLAAADAETNSSPLETEESILSSGSEVDVEAFNEEEFKVKT